MLLSVVMSKPIIAQQDGCGKGFSGDRGSCICRDAGESNAQACESQCRKRQLRRTNPAWEG